ncbi:hypothetical protein GCM10007160_34590 [Litchfieldella qijiaojingensis]|uniref:DUF1468 domain-containing protein n=1 Tax=Litchfieldella qijiaojingensis TaxID=980347 RepID=A0ABQ2Z5N0_9GAMM|nr:tripartite tricarboxylate transporter TctB family protein [Halomonas qijiaojingensis]GGY04039.1 hypothetical protein GCM10007160_34590 [Halomonas qijiaojingensis]
MKYRDTLSGLVFFAIGVTTAWIGSGFYADTAYIPVGVGVLMSVFAVPLMVRGVVGNTMSTSMPLIHHPLRFFVTLACCVLFYFLLPIIGFYTTSTLFVIVMALLLGERRPAVVICVAVVFIALLYGLFAVVLKRPLPVEFFLAS